MDRVAAASQNQALSAILFLYREVLGRELPWLDGVQRPTRPPRLSGPSQLVRLVPVVADAHLDDERHVELRHRLHQLR